MSATETPVRTDEPEEAADRRTVIAITGAVAIVLVVALGIIVFGYVPLPDYPRLDDDPDPAIPGMIVYVEASNEQSCLVTISAGGGAATEMACERDGGYFDQNLAWTADGLVVTMQYGRQGREIVAYDPQTGREVERIVVDEPPSNRPPRIVEPNLTRPEERMTRADGARLEIAHRPEGETAVRLRDAEGQRRDLLAAEGPRNYEFVSAQWSPDGEWVLVADSRGRLIVVDAGGETPRLLVERNGRDWWTTSAAWFIPGEETYTVDLADYRD
jgi:hypothetical protein